MCFFLHFCLHFVVIRAAPQNCNNILVSGDLIVCSSCRCAIGYVSENGMFYFHNVRFRNFTPIRVNVNGGQQVVFMRATDHDGKKRKRISNEIDLADEPPFKKFKFDARQEVIVNRVNLDHTDELVRPLHFVNEQQEELWDEFDILLFNEPITPAERAFFLPEYEDSDLSDSLLDDMDLSDDDSIYDFSSYPELLVEPPSPTTFYSRELGYTPEPIRSVSPYLYDSTPMWSSTASADDEFNFYFGNLSPASEYIFYVYIFRKCSEIFSQWTLVKIMI